MSFESKVKKNSPEGGKEAARKMEKTEMYEMKEKKGERPQVGHQ